MTFDIIVAADENNGIGKNGGIPWHHQTDLKFFKWLTANSTVIMGRKTYESLPISKNFGRLPGRKLKVLSRQLDYLPDAEVYNSLYEALQKSGTSTTFVIGGESIYREALKSPLLDRIYFTRIPGIHDADTFFPELPTEFNKTLIVEKDNLKFYIYSRGE